jgi:hypothetical protein
MTNWTHEKYKEEKYLKHFVEPHGIPHSMCKSPTGWNLW